MPTPAYMTIIGTKQGNITEGNFTENSVGNIWQEDHQNEILVEAFEHQVIIPRDPQSGQPTGQRVHRPLKITKVLDKSSPLLFRALTSGEILPKVSMKFYRTSTSGAMEHYFTIDLEDALIVDITDYMPNCQDPAQSHFTHLEDVFMTYRKIIKTHVVASTTESDDWRKPVMKS
ncbi:Hcp family type VI secretion system effector [Desulfovibrio litoralis]|uniref:Type VI secretion system secreted protein Hcp n=1 Tax=Desulfovibrio litoralis DSM 11393 TaxID=1121455 RepID=A0A1M7TP80_9BACT|nr:Hcp family type VI secretion system effector [Desulfovibrio litoralis]SHN72433.1 type VI secretion system secreted protein Hcp [Desulfovibrio litoralis DSM 11393]